MGAPKNIAHADWGTDPRKRQVAVAELVDDHNYRVTSLRAADPLAVAKGDLRGCAHLGGPPSGQLLIGFDFPIGVPAAYARAAGIGFFPDLLTQIGIPPWDRFADVATTAAEISLHRPFYPARPGGTQRAHLSSALGLTALEMRRRCDGRDAETMFWTLGGKQVGKAALSGWKCLNAAPRGSWRLWPFEGTLGELLDAGEGVVVVETYPREFYRYIKPPVSGGAPWSKRRQADRKLWIPSLLAWSSRLGVSWAPSVLGWVEAGFSAGANGEDEFDAVVGLLGMIAVATGLLPSGEPRDDSDVVRLEGWMLGRPAGPILSASVDPPNAARRISSMADEIRTYEELPAFVQSKMSRLDFEAWRVTGYRNIFCPDSGAALKEATALTGAGFWVAIEPTDGPAVWLHAIRLGAACTS